MNMLFRSSVQTAVLVFVIFIPGVAAQTTETRERVLEEVIVTATKRPTDIMRVPVAVSAFSMEELQRRGISEVNDLAQVSPSLDIRLGTQQSTGTEIRIRGIGSSSTNPGIEPSVGVIIDGIYRSRSGLAAGDLLDISTVEILRGPQGTLFGKNTSAGAVVINTHRPEYEWSGYAEGTVENYSGYRTTLGITGPLIDEQLAFRLAGTYHKRDGFIEDRTSSRETYDRDRLTVKGQLLWNASEDIDVRLILDYKDQNEHCCIADYTIIGPTAPIIESLGGIVKKDPFAYKSQQNYNSEDEIEEWGVSLETEWAITEELAATYLGSYRDSDIYANLDADTSNVDLVQGIDWDQNGSSSSHELRLRGINGSLDWMFGAYYYDEDADVDWQLLYGADFGAYFSAVLGGVLPPFLFPEGVGDQARIFDQESHGYALFSHNILDLGNNYELVLGLRWSYDDKSAKSTIINDAIHCDIVPFVPYCPIEGYDRSRNEDEPTGTLKLVRNFDDASIYASYARGYKSGGFNLDRDAAITVLEFEPELVDAFELGAKWRNQSGSLKIKSALFYSEFQDYQLNEFDGSSFSITNAGEVSSQGAEVELFWLATQEISITLGATYAETEFDKHPAVNNQGKSLEGMRVPFAPEWSGTGSINYDTRIAGYHTFAVLSASYMDEHNTNANLDPQTEQDAYTLVNTRIGLTSSDNSWLFSIWANNVFDEEYFEALIDTALQTGSYSGFRGSPRTYGATIRYNMQ